MERGAGSELVVKRAHGEHVVRLLLYTHRVGSWGRCVYWALQREILPEDVAVGVALKIVVRVRGVLLLRGGGGGSVRAAATGAALAWAADVLHVLLLRRRLRLGRGRAGLDVHDLLSGLALGCFGLGLLGLGTGLLEVDDFCVTIMII